MNRKNKKWVRGLSWAIFVLYMAVLIYFLFFYEEYGRDIGTKEFRYNLILFKEIKRFVRYRNLLGFQSFAINVIGNVVAFVPFGFVLPLLHRSNKNFWYVLVTGFEFSLLVELVQLTTRVGIFDVDDIFLNTLGAALGYLLYFISYKALKRLRLFH